MQEKDNVLIVSGESGGHFLPSLSLAEFLDVNKYEVVLVFPEKIEEIGIPLSDTNIKYVKINNKKRLSYIRLFFKAYSLIRFYRPKILISFGGSFSLFFVFLAKLFKIKIIIHEQNRIFGKANKIASFFADKILVNMPILNTNKNYIRVGYPLRNYTVIEKNADNKKIHKNNILIIGGSQGSVFLNKLIVDMIDEFNEYIADKYRFFHIVGKKNHLKEIKDKYIEYGIEADVFGYFTNPFELYSKADLIIARAGAGVLSEISFFALPSILIPYPFADAHQELNAQYYVENRAAVVIKQNEVDEKKLFLLIKEVIEDNRIENKLGKNAKKITIEKPLKLFAAELY